ncbi:MAG: hypothetical protein IIA70_03880, partial [Proteobacteria bacterium]|nr:hypothetical protein [Pseudomonadota bacterium]
RPVHGRDRLRPSRLQRRGLLRRLAPLAGGGPRRVADLQPLGSRGHEDIQIEVVITRPGRIVAGDPRTGLSAEALKANYDAAVEVGEMLTTTSEALTRLIEARDDIELLKGWAAKAKKASGEENDNQKEDGSEQAAADSTENGEKNGEESETPDNPYDAFIKEADATLEKLNELEKNIWTPPDTKGFVDTSYKLTNYIFTASFYVQSSYDAPSATAQAAMEEARRKLAERIGELDAIFAGDIANLRDRAAELELGVLRPVEPLGDS